MAQRMGIVWNPTKIDGEVLREAVTASVPEDTELKWWETTADDPGRAMTAEAVRAACDVVIAVGGDGTVRTVAEILASAGDDAPALGIVPQGTGNLLARNLGIPVGSIPKALNVIAAGNQRRIDMGWTRTDDAEVETGFLVMVGFGLDAHMLAETDNDLKGKAGWLAYVAAMGRAVTASETVDFRITLDDGEQQTLSGHTLLIGNCGDIQGGFTLLPDAQIDDGRLDLLLISAENVTQWLQTLRTVVWDNGIRRLLGGDDETVSNDFTQHLTGEIIAVALPGPVPFEIDGEEAGAISKLAVRVQPGALRVLC